jgi:transposase
MFGQFLTSEARLAIEELRGNTRDKGAYMKLSVLILLDMGKGYDEIELILGIGRGSITNCRQKYEADGLAKYLDRHYVPYSGRLEAEALQQIDRQVSDHIYTTSQEIQAYILETFGLEYSLSAVRSIMEKLDFVYKKTMELPGKYDAAEQEAFLAEMQPFLAEIEENEAVFFVDAVHPQHNTRSTYAWIKKGQDKLIPCNTGRRRVNINGAMNAHHPEEVVIHEADTINAEATIALYDKIQQRYPDKEHIYVIGDNARYYYNAQLQAWLAQNPRIKQVFLPTYSPNLNLIERLWKFLRKKVINTHFYPDFKDFRQAILHFFEHIEQYKAELDSLMTFKFQRLGKTDVAKTAFKTTSC